MKVFAFRRIVWACSILLLLLCGFVWSANEADLDKIKQAIQEKGARWKAAENPISRLPDHQKKLRLGAILSAEEPKGARPDKPNKPGKPDEPGSGKVPKRFDWRSKDGKNWITPVKDQDGCGSCWAFGSVGQLESLICTPNDTPYPADLDLSEQFLVSCDFSSLGCYGGYVIRAYDFLRDTGTTDEGCFPYAASDLPCSDRCSDWETRLQKIRSWSLVPRKIGTLKRAIMENPLTVAFRVYEDFYSYVGGVYEYVWGPFKGAHVVLVIGWDDRPPEGIPCFICKNSWGTGWGEPWPLPPDAPVEDGGFFRIAQNQIRSSEVRFGSDAGNFDPVSEPSPAPPRPGFETLVTLWGEIRKTY